MAGDGRDAEQDVSKPAAQLALIERLLTEAGRAEALPAVRDAAAQQPQTIRMALHLGRHLLASDPAAAEAAFRAAIAAGPDRQPALSGLAEALWRQDRKPEAIAAATEAVAAAPGAPAARLRLEQLLLVEGSDPGATEANFRALLDLDGTSGPAWLGLVDALLRQDRRAEALEVARAAREAQPNDARLHLRYGQLLLGPGGDLEEAGAAFEAALAMDPRLGGALVGRIDLLRRQGRGAEAMTAAAEAEALAPEDPWVQVRLGEVTLEAGGDPVEAEAAFRAALGRHPGLPQALLGLCEALRRQRRIKESVAAFREAAAANPPPALLRQQRYRLFGHYD